MLRWLPVLFIMALVACEIRAAEVTVRASRQGEALVVEASAEFDAGIRQTWRVLTDYDHLSDFIPGLRVSRVVMRDGSNAVIEQEGEARLLFYSCPVELRLAVEEIPYRRIFSHAVGGNFRSMRNAYYLEPRGARTRLRYVGIMIPDFPLPPLIGTIVLRNNIETQFSAMVDEIMRRQRSSLARGPAMPRSGR